MIDLHSHIFPGVDDGSQDILTSWDMLLEAYNSGTEGIVATPHCNIPGMYRNYTDSEIGEEWNRFLRELEWMGLPDIRIYRGMEVYTTEQVPDLIREGLVWTINDTRYFLMEFGFDEDPAFCNYMIRAIKKTGVSPVIAHPERYHFIQETPQLAYLWCTNGCALQINKDSILGRFGQREKEIADRLLRHGLVAVVASDAHGTRSRTTSLAGVWDYLVPRFGEQYAGLLLEENPDRILHGRELLGFRPLPFRESDEP